MANSRELRRSLIVLVFSSALCLSQGCARQESLHDSGITEQKLPFHSELHPASESDLDRPVVPADQKRDSEIPFQTGSRPRILPSGTLLTVQLGGSLAASEVHAGEEFTAYVSAPLTIDGEVLVDRGTLVTGRIESTQSDTARAPALGYFQLTLEGIAVKGRTVALQTSSLFTRGTALPSNISSQASSVRVQKGRRLTFRLISPVELSESNSTGNRQYAGLDH